MTRMHRLLGVSLVLIGTPAFAQTTTTGSISGVVTNAAGAPIAGATVTARSAQVTRTITTGADGSFRLGLLNPGDWDVQATKEGLQPSRRTVHVSTNADAGVSIKLATEATQTVDIVSSSVDVTTTQQGLTMSSEKLAALPIGSRDFTDIAYFSPGVVGGGQDFGFGALNKSPSISGASSAENAFIVDGLQTTDFRTGGQGSGLKTDFVDQVEVQTGGFKPEYSALGGVFNAILKSGTNDFKGSAWLTWDPIGIYAQTKDNLYFTAQKPFARYDIGAELGGPVIKDKLFYWVGVDANILESPGSNPNKDPGLVSSKDKIQELNFVGKLNWYLTQDQQLTFSVAFNPTDNKQDTAYPNFGDGNTGSDAKSTQESVSLNYDWTITPSLFLSLKGGWNQNKDETTPTDPSDSVTDYAYYNVGPFPNPSYSGFAYVRGGSANYDTILQKGVSKQLRADLSWFVGTHNLKFGTSWLQSDYTRRFNVNDSSNTFTVAPDASYLNQQIYSSNSTVRAEYTALYAQDTWEAVPGFRAFYGLRWEQQVQKNSAGQTFMKFNDFKDYAQPRVGFTWDVNNDGKAKVSGSYGVYFEAIPQRLATRVFGNEVFLSYYYNSPKFTYDPTNPNHYGTVTGGLGAGNADFTIDYGTPFSYDPIAEGTKLPQRQEYTLGFDYTLPDGIVAGVHGKHRHLKNVIEDSVITHLNGGAYDPGVPYDSAGDTAGQAILWNPGSSAAWTSRSNDVMPNTRFVVGGTNFEPAQNTYDSVDFTLSGKTAHATWDFNYTWSRLQGNYEGLVSSSNGQADGNITASFDYWPYVGYGLLPLDRTHVLKFFGSYRWDFGKNAVNLGYNWTYQSGTPISLLDDGSTTHGHAPGYDTQYNTTTGGTVGPGYVASSPAAYNTPGNWTGNAVGSGTYTGPGYYSLDLGGYGNAVFADGEQGQYGRTPALNTVDLHLDFVWAVGPKFRVIPSVDMFNALNTRTATGVYQLATDGNGFAQPSYGVANGYLAGRHYRFGVKLQF